MDSLVEKREDEKELFGKRLNIAGIYLDSHVEKREDEKELFGKRLNIAGLCLDSGQPC